MILAGRSLQYCSVNAVFFFKAPFLAPHYSHLYISDLLDAICIIAVSGDDTTVHLKCDQAYDFLRTTRIYF